MNRPAALLTLALLVLFAAPAPAGAQEGARRLAATANGVSAGSSANEGEIQECTASGCSFALTAPARPPATWNGELPVSGGTVIELDYGRAVQVNGAQIVDRQFKQLASAAVERVDDARWRIVVSRTALPDRAAVRVLATWTGEDARARYTVHRTDFIGVQAPVSIFGVTQTPGSGPVADVDVRAAGRVDARLTFGPRTLGAATLALDRGRRLSLPVKLSSGARTLLRKRGRLKATLTITALPLSGDPVAIDRRVTLRRKRR